MYLSRITLSERAFEAPGAGEVFRSPYTVHQAVWYLFADRKDRKRDFLYRLDRSGRRPVVYAVSAREPFCSRGIWNLEVKPYAPKLVGDMRLAFTLRANPVVTKRDDRGKHHRHDVVMNAKKNLSTRSGLNINDLVQESASAWLQGRSEKSGFSVEDGYVRADAYAQHRFRKGNRHVSISTVDFNGIITVIDPERLTETLYNGIGPAKGFGCGLMMLRRI